jgi:hypothetical protein
MWVCGPKIVFYQLQARSISQGRFIIAICCLCSCAYTHMATGVLRQNNQMLGCVFLTAVAMWWCMDAARYEAVLHVLALCMCSIFQGCSHSLIHSLTH